jgi:hypothetical protein
VVAALMVLPAAFWIGLWGCLGFLAFLLLFHRQISARLQGHNGAGKVRWKWSLETAVSILLIAGSIGMTILLGFVSASRPLTSVESTLFQGVSLFIGLLGSLLFGRQSATAAARDMVKPHARSAFRRVLALNGSLVRLSFMIARIRSGEGANTPPTGNLQLDTMEAVVAEQITIATDALEDWRDLIPEDVAEVERRLRERAK